MKHSTFTRGAAAAIVSCIILYSCNDNSKKTEVTTTSDTSAVLTPPVIVKDSLGMKDTMPKNAIDTEKTEQTPPPRPH